MIEKMDDAVQASRLEQLLLYDERAVRKSKMDHTFSKLKLTKKGENRLNNLTNKRFS